MNKNRYTPLALGLAAIFSLGSAHASIITIGDGNHGSNLGDGDIIIGDNASCVSFFNNPTACTVMGDGAYSYYGGTSIGAGARSNRGSTAIGQNADAAEGAVAIGQDSAAAPNSVAIQGSAVGHAGIIAIRGTADAAGSVAIGGHTRGRANTVSFGDANSGYTRVLANVSEGTLDTDAVNVKQLNDAIAGIVIPPGQANPYFKANGSTSGGDEAQATGEGSTSSGPQSVASGDFSVANGLKASAGGQSSVAVGDEANAGGDQSISIGVLSRAPGQNAVAVGASANAPGESAVAIGNAALSEGIGAVSIGWAGAYADGSVSIGHGSFTLHANSVALGSHTNTTRENEVAVGGRVVGQVGNGVLDTDAVNVGQVAPIGNFFGAGAGFMGGAWTAPNFAFPSGSSFNNVYDALLYLDGRIDNIATGPGEPGTPGAPGSQGPQGERGFDGRSAYEVAVDEGFEGNEQEWLESLQGADGRDGVGGGSKAVAGSNIEVEDNEDGTQTVSVADNIELSDQGSLKVGATTVNAEGVSIQGGPSMTRNGIDAGGQRITGVAPGRIAKGSMDAVNGGQLWDLENRLDDRWKAVDRRMSGMCAMGAAQSQAVSASANNPATRKWMAGVGFCGGQAAISAGYSQDFTTPRGSIMSFSAGISSSGDDTSVGFGLSSGW